MTYYRVSVLGPTRHGFSIVDLWGKRTLQEPRVFARSEPLTTPADLESKKAPVFFEQNPTPVVLEQTSTSIPIPTPIPRPDSPSQLRIIRFDESPKKKAPVPVPDKARALLEKKTVSELRQHCSELGLKQTGLKRDLVDRIYNKMITVVVIPPTVKQEQKLLPQQPPATPTPVAAPADAEESEESEESEEYEEAEEFEESESEEEESEGESEGDPDSLAK